MLDPSTSDPIASLPPLTTQPALSSDDKVAALRLVADSVAQQRQLASRALIFHPLTVVSSVGLLAMIGQWLYKGSRSDLAVIGTTFGGIIMAVLISVRWASGGYIPLAEETGTWAWLDRGQTSGKEDDILITKFGDEVIGALVLRGAKDVDSGSAGGGGSPRKRRQSGGAGRLKGIVRAWTVKQRYRKKRVGEGLLEEAMRMCNERGWSGPRFAEDHANSRRVLPATFNGGFDRRDRRAKDMLAAMVGETSGSPVSSRSRGAKR